MGIINSIVKYFAERNAYKTVAKSQLWLTAMIYCNKAFNQGPMKTVDQETKSSISLRIVKLIQDIENSSDKIKTMRFHLVESVIDCAKYQVVVFDKNDGHNNILLDKEGISGELKQFSLDIIKKDELLKEIIHSLPNEDLTVAHQIYYAKYYQCHLIMSALNVIRVTLKDHNPVDSKDWFKPLYHSQCVWAEEMHRKSIGLNSVFKNPLASFFYSSFANLVLQGHKYPDLKFFENYESQILDGTINPPKFD